MPNENKDASPLPLFYKNPEPLDAKRHANLALRKNFSWVLQKK